jgi:indole-3-glycerol phosphate synthase
MNVLSEIIAQKRLRVARAKELVGFYVLRDQAFAKRTSAKPHALRAALQIEGVNIIAEFKRRSPSKGVIREDADLSSIVRSYQAGGAVALSILTEEDYFDGALSDLVEAKTLVNLPVLRKDFVFDEYQIYESAVVGADAVLLIVSVLDDRQLESLRRVAEDDLGMDALVEVHNSEEMDRAASCGAKIVGVNNRNLRTFEVSLETSVELASLAPRDALLVSESGLSTGADLRRLQEKGFSGFLIGESLMRARDPETALRDLRS